MTIKEAILVAEAGKTAISELEKIRDKGFQELEDLKKEAISAAMKGDIKKVFELLNRADYVHDRTNNRIQQTADVFLNEIKEFVEENK